LVIGSMRAGIWFILAAILGLLSLATYPRQTSPKVSEAPQYFPPPQPPPPQPQSAQPVQPVETTLPVAPPPVYQFDVHRTSDTKFIVTVPRSDEWVDTKVPVIVHEAVTITPGDGTNYSFKPVAFFHDKEYYLGPFGAPPGWHAISIYTQTNTFPADLCETIKLRIFNAPVGTLSIELGELVADHDMDPNFYGLAGGEAWRTRYAQYAQLRAAAVQQQKQMIYNIPLR
jgi:hypothetical protein